MDLPPDLDLTPEQRATLERVIAPAAPRAVDADLVEALRARIDEGLGTDTVPGGITLGKWLVGALDRCDGMFVATVLGEGPPFTYALKTAIGAVLHRAIQSEIQTGAATRADDPAEDVARAAAAHLVEHRRDFADFWRDSDEGSRDEIVRRSAEMLTIFRSTFPPLRRLRGELSPTAEFKLSAAFLEGNVEFVGRPDLALGRIEPGFWSRVIIDHKTGAANAGQIEDLRFYALLQALGTKAQVPPFRVATYLAEGGTFQVEDVTEETLLHAADRAAAAARRAIEVLDGDDVRSLSPGPWCGWCPRATSCPQASAEALAGRDGRDG